MVRVCEDGFGSICNPFTKRNEQVRRFTISNKRMMSVQVITYGATITSLHVPDANGKPDDVALGYDDIAGYQTSSNPYIGGTIGRVCSRVSNGHYSYAGYEVDVSKNFLGKHQLHGGIMGFDKVNWQVAAVRSDGVVFKFCSPDGHEGYPGNLVATITFTLSEDCSFKFCLEATTDKATPCNMTNHAYYNLAGHHTGRKGMYEHMVMIKAEKYTEKDNETVPTGRIRELKGMPFDCRKMVNVGRALDKMFPKGYDDNYVLEGYTPKGLVAQAKVYHPPSGRYMEVYSNQPCMHFYTSHNMPDLDRGEAPTIIGKDKIPYGKYHGFCVETHWYPDAVNHPNFPSVILQPGEKYMHICMFKFGACKTVNK